MDEPMGGAIYARLELDSGNLKQEAEAAKRVMDDVAKATGGVGSAVDAAGGRLRDATGRFVATGGAAKGMAADMGVAGEAAAKATMTISTGMERVNKATSISSQKLQVFGQTLDDMQYVSEQGLRPILGNLMQISPILGIAAIAADQFIKKFPSGARSVDPMLDAMGSLKERIQKINDKPIMLAVDRLELTQAEQQLERLARAQESLNRIRGMKTGAERQSEAATDEALQEAGGPRIFQKIQDSIEKRDLASDPDLKKRREEADRKRAQIASAESRDDRFMPENAAAIAQAKAELAAAENAIARRQQALKEGAGLKAGEIMGPAAPGQDVAKHQAEKAAMLRSVGEGGLAETFEANSPAMIRAQEASRREYAQTLVDVEKARRNIQGPGRKEGYDAETAERLEREREEATAARKAASDLKGAESAAEQVKIKGMTQEQARRYRLDQLKRKAAGVPAADAGGAPPRIEAPAGVPVADNGNSAALLKAVETLIKINQDVAEHTGRMASDGIVGVMG